MCHWCQCGGGEERVVWVSNTVSRNKGELIVGIIVKTIVTLSQYHIASDPKYQHIPVVFDERHFIDDLKGHDDG